MAKYMRNQNLVSQSKQRRRLFLETLEARQMMAADAVLTWNEHLKDRKSVV